MSLAASLAAGARDRGFDARLVEADALVTGRGWLLRARRAGIESIAAAHLVSALERRLMHIEPNLVLVVKGRLIGARTVALLRRVLSVPLVNYYPDDPLWPRYSDPQVVAALREYDEVVVWGDHVAERLVDAGVERTRVIPFGYDDAVYRPPSTPPPERYWDAAMIGQCYERRVRFLEPLADRRVLISGTGWTRCVRGGPLEGRVSDRTYPGAEVCSIYWRSAIGLNILEESNIPATNMRSFEIPASGTAMVVTRTPVHERLFGDDGAVLVDAPEEMAEAVRDLLQDEDRLRVVARRGLECVRPHTYAARMATLLAPWFPMMGVGAAVG
jgi:spore maturation protein CgeB